jgi:hypothetical protein
MSIINKFIIQKQSVTYFVYFNHVFLQITIMIDTQQQYIKLNIRGEILIIVMNKFFMTILRLIRRVQNCFNDIIQ